MNPTACRYPVAILVMASLVTGCSGKSATIQTIEVRSFKVLFCTNDTRPRIENTISSVSDIEGGKFLGPDDDSLIDPDRLESAARNLSGLVAGSDDKIMDIRVLRDLSVENLQVAIDSALLTIKNNNPEDFANNSIYIVLPDGILPEKIIRQPEGPVQNKGSERKKE